MGVPEAEEKPKRKAATRKRCAGKKACDGAPTLDAISRVLKGLSLEELNEKARAMVAGLGEHALKGNVSSIRMLLRLAEQSEQRAEMAPEEASGMLEREIALGMGEDEE
jgi:hypothetical protein